MVKPLGPMCVRATARAIRRTTRTCLKCGEPFNSDWAGHRLCAECDRNNQQYLRKREYVRLKDSQEER